MNITNTNRRKIIAQNIGFIDRQIRALAGAAMLITPLAIQPETMGSWSIIILLAIPLISSAIIGWDPIFALFGKSTFVETEAEIQQRSWSVANIGIMDRGIRLGVGGILLYSLLTITTTMTPGMAMTLLAIPLIVSAITAWDPIYAALNINSFGSRIDVEAAEPEADLATLAKCYKFPTTQPSTRTYSNAA
ncbi:MAG: DUF2892 domain-containing protein [Gammaproteobacteria bacterium]|jgi:hypothetical protein